MTILAGFVKQISHFLFSMSNQVSRDKAA